MSQKKQSTNLPAEQFLQLIRQTPNICLIDVRSVEEHTTFNIGGRCIPLDELSEHISSLNPDQTTLVYCAKGIRSQMAADFLLSARFREVYSLADGLHGLKANP